MKLNVQKTYFFYRFLRNQNFMFNTSWQKPFRADPTNFCAI